MKTLYTNNQTSHFDNFSFDVLTSEELALVKGGKEDDSYIEPPHRVTTFSFKKKF